MKPPTADIIEALEHHQSITDAAKELGIPRLQIYRRAKTDKHIQDVLEELRKAKDSVIVSLRMPAKLKAQLDKRAAKENKTFTEIVIELCQSVV